MTKQCFKVDNPREWYLPHHTVVHPLKPGKVRRVLNGAAKFQGQSLQQRLVNRTGLVAKINPHSNPFSRVQVCRLSRHRRNVLQVGVVPHDRPLLRFFLRRKDPASEIAENQYARQFLAPKTRLHTSTTR